MYFEFDDVRRIHQPYTDNFTRGRFYCSQMLKLIYSLFSSNLEGTNIQFSVAQLAQRNVCNVNKCFAGKLNISLIMTLDFGMSAEETAIWFGILTLIVVEVGLITPPVGLNVFVSAPSLDKTSAASSVISRLNERSRKEPCKRSTFGLWLTCSELLRRSPSIG